MFAGFKFEFCPGGSLDKELAGSLHLGQIILLGAHHLSAQLGNPGLSRPRLSAEAGNLC